MELVDGLVILGSVWSLLGGVYLYLTIKRQTDTELEQYRQMKISERSQMKPREWWQEAVVNLSQHPEVLQQIIPMANSGTLQQILQNIVKK